MDPDAHVAVDEKCDAAKQREALLVEAIAAMTADAVINVTDLQPRAMAYRTGITGPKQPWSGEGAFTWNSWECCRTPRRRRRCREARVEAF